MNGNKQHILTGVLGVAIFLGVLFGRPEIKVNVLPTPVQTTEKTSSPKLGLSNSTIIGPDLTWGDRTVTNSPSSFLTGTSTLCSIQSPLYGTTTLESFSAIITTSTSTPVLVVLENTLSNPYPPSLAQASSTRILGSFNLASGATPEFLFTATSTTFVGRTDVFGPGTWLNFYAKNGGNGSISQNFGAGSVFPGTCSATFLEM